MTRHVREDPYSIVIEYGEGAYGPTIHLDILEEQTLLKLKMLFMELASGARRDVDLLAEPYVESSGISEFRLRTVPEGKTISSGVVRQSDRDKSLPGFIWLNDLEGWAGCAELLDGLLSAGLPGHQYFAEGQITVEVDFKETR